MNISQAKKNLLYLSLAMMLVTTLIFYYVSYSTQKTLRKSEQNPRNPGIPMALSLSYWEQTANALANLYDMQCWANTVNISYVVQPAIKSYGKSVFHFAEDEQVLQFEDLFDISHWNQISLKQNFSPLARLSFFLQHASRKIIYVHIVYRYFSYRCDSFKGTKWYRFLKFFNFHVIKQVCIDLKREPHVVLSKEFEDGIYADVHENVTIVFHNWEGIRNTRAERVALSGSRCNREFKKMVFINFTYSPAPIFGSQYPSLPVLPSELNAKRVDMFLSRYLPGRRYIAVT